MSPYVVGTQSIDYSRDVVKYNQLPRRRSVTLPCAEDAQSIDYSRDGVNYHWFPRSRSVIAPPTQCIPKALITVPTLPNIINFPDAGQWHYCTQGIPKALIIAGTSSNFTDLDVAGQWYYHTRRIPRALIIAGTSSKSVGGVLKYHWFPHRRSVMLPYAEDTQSTVYSRYVFKYHIISLLPPSQVSDITIRRGYQKHLL